VSRADRRVPSSVDQSERAAERGYVDNVIEPSDARPKLIGALEVIETKRATTKKHGNIPLLTKFV
jgi:acetyl-CoA carboxylase carboxyltransferase component